MDSCESEKSKNKTREESEEGDYLPFFGNFLSTSGIRCVNKNDVRFWDILLAYNAYFLPIISLFFWIVFLVL